MGIDPGSNSTGYGIVDQTGGKLHIVACGAIRNRPDRPFPERLKKIYDELMRIIAEHSPDAVAVEDLFFAANAKSALKLGQTRGVTLLAAANSLKPIGEYTPTQIKLAVVGHGHADKEQVRSMVIALLRLKEIPQPHDATDALAVAICHIHTAATQARLAPATRARRVSP